MQFDLMRADNRPLKIPIGERGNMRRRYGDDAGTRLLRVGGIRRLLHTSLNLSSTFWKLA